jgi:hypothetical protein
MLLRTCRWLTLTLTALSMGVAFAHALQLLPKMQYAPALYLTLFKSLYEYYGKIAGWFEVGAVLAAIALVYLVRDRRPAFLPTLIGTACLVAAHAAYWIWVAPANNLMASWPVESPPADWTRVRDQWEYTHLARFFLQLLALAALQLSVVLETPDMAAETVATEQRPPFHGTRPSAA